MTIEEYKQKLDEYLGMTGELTLIANVDKWAELFGVQR